VGCAVTISVVSASEIHLKTPDGPAGKSEAVRDRAVLGSHQTLGATRTGHLLWELSSRMTAMLDSSIGETQLRAQSIGSLEKIAETPAINVSELARWAMKSQQAVSQNVERLERLEYVERRVGKGRGIQLYITVAGEEALKRGSEAEAEFERELERLFGPELYERLHSSLQEAGEVLRSCPRPLSPNA
jgi:DNA-binding MarR family transcriptional regulator